MVYSHTISINSKKELDMIKVTEEVRGALDRSKIKNGIVTVFIPGATGAVTVIEYEKGLLKDFADALERVAPKNINYAHHDKGDDENGRSHVKASLIGPSITVPFKNGKLIMGIWQEIVFVELDARPRERQIIVQIIGE